MTYDEFVSGWDHSKFTFRNNRSREALTVETPLDDGKRKAVSDYVGIRISSSDDPRLYWTASDVEVFDGNGSSIGYFKKNGRILDFDEQKVV